MTLGWKILKMVEIRGKYLVFSRGEGPKSDKGYLRRMKMKDIMIIYLRKVGGFGRKSMLHRL